MDQTQIDRSSLYREVRTNLVDRLVHMALGFTAQMIEKMPYMRSSGCCSRSLVRSTICRRGLWQFGLWKKFLATRYGNDWTKSHRRSKNRNQCW